MFADIGASLGQFTKAAASCLRDAQILAVEADPVRFAELERNCAAWSRESENRVTAVHAAAAAEDGRVRFHVTQSSVSGGLFRHEGAHLEPAARTKIDWTEVEVAARSLDSLFPDSPPDFVKMDIEGGELMAMRGATRILSAGKTTFLVELHDFAGPDGDSIPDGVRAIFRAHGYSGIEIAGKTLFLRSPFVRVPVLATMQFARGQYRTLRRFVRRVLK